MRSQQKSQSLTVQSEDAVCLVVEVCAGTIGRAPGSCSGEDHLTTFGPGLVKVGEFLDLVWMSGGQIPGFSPVRHNIIKLPIAMVTWHEFPLVQALGAVSK